MGCGTARTSAGGQKSSDSDLTKNLRRLDSFGTRSLRRILGYRWLDFVCSERLLRDGHERQLQLYGHVARFPDADPAYQILSEGVL